LGGGKVGGLKTSIAQNACVTFIVATNWASNDGLEFVPTGLRVRGRGQKIFPKTLFAAFDATPKDFCRLSLRFRAYSAKIV
jgi:hypothetical protein